MVYTTKNSGETEKLAMKVARNAKAGDVFALFGDLGSGKTTFCKGFCRFLGVEENITSPTFVIMKNYLLEKEHRGIRELVHVDAYRIEEIRSSGLDDYLKRDDAIILIEWPKQIENFLPQAKRIFFEYIDENTRRIEVG